MTDSFPRQQARTKKFSCGVPRSFQVSPDGRRIVFLRSQGGTDPVTCLWVRDLAADAERLVVDPAAIDGDTDEPEAERARRERSREAAGGVVAFGTDAEFELATFALAGRVYVARLAAGAKGATLVSTATPAIDPRLDPTGRRIAYVCEGAVRIADPRTGTDAELIGPGDDADVSYGLAEFVAAEEMGRFRGYWWAPDGSALLVARVDNAPVQRWYIADPANPERQPAQLSYPAAGTPNADVSLLLVSLDGTVTPVQWDAAAQPYLAAADWDAAGPLAVVQSRDQRSLRLLSVNTQSGETVSLRDDSDPIWLDLVSGVPARLADGRVVWTATADDTRRLIVAAPGALADGSAEPVTPPGLQVREVLSVTDDTVLFAASGDEPSETSVWTYGPAGLTQISQSPGVHSGVGAGHTIVLSSRTLADLGTETTVLRADSTGATTPVTTIASLADRPMITPTVRMLKAGQRELRTALLLPTGHQPSSTPLPVLMDPYGGPHAQRALASAGAHLTSQWFADQGFAVIVADGRGTPGRGADWDRAVAGDFVGPILDDQVDALGSVAEQCAATGLANLDLTKVGIRGWSFGGYLAALAVLRRPDVFHRRHRRRASHGVAAL